MATYPTNAYRNGTMYSSYTAASFARKYELAEIYGVNFLGAVSWSFEFEDHPGSTVSENVFRMFGKMSGKRVKVSSSRMYVLKQILDSGIRRETDIGVLAAVDKKSSAVMVWNYHDADETGTTEQVELKITGIPARKIKLTHYRIDQEFSNSYEVWKKMGSPRQPDLEQISILEKAGQLQTSGEPEKMEVANGKLLYKISIPRQGISLLKIDWN
jgi:xylan 1,4-beta-xylosidase